MVHYFGRKEDLFAAAVKLPFAPDQAISEVFAPTGGGPEEIAHRLATLFFTAWEIPETREALIGQLRMALTTGQPPPIRDFISEVILQRIVGFIDGPDPHLRVELAASHLLGAAMLRYVLELEPLASLPIERVIEEIAPRLASYLDARPR